MASRLILIKAVLQSMPLYLFSVLAAPKWALKKIKDLQRKFLWGSTGQNRKWALVKWATVCTPKKQGGLGLRDPQHNTGSLIWNAAKQHKELIQNHSFWEIHDGRTTHFWVDSWQQRPKIAEILPPPIHDGNNLNQTDHVSQYWTQSINQGFRQWKPTEQIIHHETEDYYSDLHKELTSRKIRCTTGKDVMRWGYTPRGNYTTKEAYKLMLQTQELVDPAWTRLWTTRISPKISTFTWLLYHQRILTWDNLIKRGFQGPSYCPNCQKQGEAIQDLMDSTHMANQLWEELTFKCQRPCRTLGDIKGTIRNWTPAPYKRKLLNALWTTLSSFLF
eukprot:PITA_18592